MNLLLMIRDEMINMANAPLPYPRGLLVSQGLKIPLLFLFILFHLFTSQIWTKTLTTPS